MTDKKLIATAFGEYDAKVYVHGMTTEQRRHVEQAFMAGAKAAMFELFKEPSAVKDIDEELGAWFERWIAQMKEKKQ